MAQPFVGEIRLFSIPFAPKGWHQCDGTMLSIAQNQALFAIIGTTYGGDGMNTFALPDLRGRVPVNFQGGISLGERAGETAHTLTAGEMPMHQHLAQADNTAASTKQATGNVWAASQNMIYADAANTTMNQGALVASGGSQPHENMQPYLVLNYCIAMEGIFPSRN